MKNILSFQQAIPFFFKALLVVCLSYGCGQFALDWLSEQKRLAYLPTIFIFLLLAESIRLRYRGKEEQSWAMIAAGSASIPQVTLVVTSVRPDSDVAGLIFIVLINTGLVYLGIQCARALRWGNLLLVVLLQIFIAFCFLVASTPNL